MSAPAKVRSAFPTLGEMIEDLLASETYSFSPVHVQRWWFWKQERPDGHITIIPWLTCFRVLWWGSGHLPTPHMYAIDIDRQFGFPVGRVRVCDSAELGNPRVLKDSEQADRIHTRICDHVVQAWHSLQQEAT